MHTIKLKISDSIYDKVIGLLGKFDKSELEIIQDDKNYSENKQYLEAELKTVKEGKAKYVSMNQLNENVEKTLKKHGN